MHLNCLTHHNIIINEQIIVLTSLLELQSIRLQILVCFIQLTVVRTHSCLIIKRDASTVQPTFPNTPLTMILSKSQTQSQKASNLFPCLNLLQSNSHREESFWSKSTVCAPRTMKSVKLSEKKIPMQ